MKEYYSTLNNYNKYYYLVLRLEEKTLENLLTKNLKGLTGISNSVDIINSYFDIRDLLLIMKKEDVENLNDLTHVKYNDIDFLVKDNFKVLRRLYDNSDTLHVSSLLYQGIRKTEYYKLSNKEIGSKIENHNLKYLYRNAKCRLWKEYQKFDGNYGVHKLRDIKSVKNYDDLLNQSLELLNKDRIEFSKSDLDIILRFIIIGFANCFTHEQEVFINNTFIIPDGSVLFIKEQHPESYKFEDGAQLIDKYHPILNKNFNIKRLKYNRSVGGIISDTHKPVFSYIRYLEKMF